MNKVMLMGRLTKDPEFRETNASSVASFPLAVDRPFSKSEKKTDFINCQVWAKKAEVFRDYVTKGTKILITGRIQTGSYQNKEGKTVYTTDVVVEDFEFCESKKKGEENNEPKRPDSSATDDFMNVGVVEDLPFEFADN